MDALTAILEAAAPDTALFSRARLHAPFGVRTSGTDAAIFHLFLKGGGWLCPDGHDPLEVHAGDLVLLAHGSGHVIADHTDTPPTPIRSLPVVTAPDGLPCVVQDGAGDATEIVCGTLRFGPGGRHFVVPRMPPVIHVRTAPVAWLDATVQMLAAEIDSEAPGAQLLVQRLTEILVVQALRAWIQSGTGQRGWPAALADARLARALSSIHGNPSHPWSVAELARRAGMSRSSFYTRFGDVLGEPPRSYLTRWRMVLAQQALRRTGTRISEVAEAVGYATEAAFCRAFKREVGLTPAGWRAQAA